MAIFAGTGEGDSYQSLHRVERGADGVLRLGKPICAVGEQRRCAGFNALVHGHGVGGAGNHADMPSRVLEAQPLVSDEADESEAFASLALGKKIDCEGARYRVPSFIVSYQSKKPPRLRGLKSRGGEVGIRTLDALVGHTHLAGEHLRPLGHFSTL